MPGERVYTATLIADPAETRFMNASYKPVDIPAFDCKGSVLTVMVLHLRDTEPEILYPQLEEKIGGARAFFANAPMLIDLRSVDGPGQAALDLPTLERVQAVLEQVVGDLDRRAQESVAG